MKVLVDKNVIESMIKCNECMQFSDTNHTSFHDPCPNEVHYK